MQGQPPLLRHSHAPIHIHVSPLELHHIISEGEGVTMVEERTVVQSYDRGLRVFGPVAVPAAGVATAEGIPHVLIPCYRCAVGILIPVNDHIPTIPVWIHSHLRVVAAVLRAVTQ